MRETLLKRKKHVQELIETICSHPAVTYNLSKDGLAAGRQQNKEKPGKRAGNGFSIQKRCADVFYLTKQLMTKNRHLRQICPRSSVSGPNNSTLYALSILYLLYILSSMSYSVHICQCYSAYRPSGHLRTFTDLPTDHQPFN